jgi:lipopolysaccharide biosynthesis regulator YciM
MYSKKKEVREMPAKKKASYKCVKCGYKSSKPGRCCGAPMKKMAK